MEYIFTSFKCDKSNANARFPLEINKITFTGSQQQTPTSNVLKHKTGEATKGRTSVPIVIVDCDDDNHLPKMIYRLLTLVFHAGCTILLPLHQTLWRRASIQMVGQLLFDGNFLGPLQLRQCLKKGMTCIFVTFSFSSVAQDDRNCQNT